MNSTIIMHDRLESLSTCHCNVPAMTKLSRKMKGGKQIRKNIENLKEEWNVG
jgi:hypothetical protein